MGSIKEKLAHDKRLFIDERNLNRLSSESDYDHYSIDIVKVGNILRKEEETGRIIMLRDTRVYAYLKGTDEGREKYRDYCDFCNVSFRNESEYNLLIENMKTNPYDIVKGAIVIHQYNLILDGQHRSCILLLLYGPKYVVKVVRLHRKISPPICVS